MPKVEPMSTRNSQAVVKPAKNLKKRTAKPARSLAKKIVKK